MAEQRERVQRQKERQEQQAAAQARADAQSAAAEGDLRDKLQRAEARCNEHVEERERLLAADTDACAAHAALETRVADLVAEKSTAEKVVAKARAESQRVLRRNEELAIQLGMAKAMVGSPASAAATLRPDSDASARPGAGARFGTPLQQESSNSVLSMSSAMNPLLSGTPAATALATIAQQTPMPMPTTVPPASAGAGSGRRDPASTSESAKRKSRATPPTPASAHARHSHSPRPPSLGNMLWHVVGGIVGGTGATLRAAQEEGQEAVASSDDE